MNDIKQIDLSAFGGEGVMEVSLPTLSMKVKLKNELGKRARMKVVDGEQILTYDDMGDVEILKTLSYVRSAPFQTTVRGFLAYCDSLDAVQVGNGEKLLQAIADAVAELIEAPGPLEG